MNARKANVNDVKAIHGLINAYAERDQMLFRSMADIYKNLQTFSVVEDDGQVVGCCALEVIWSDLAEIKSLAVEETHKGRGAGAMLVNAEVEQAKRLGLPKVFGLTLKPQFFEKLGFKIVDKSYLPMKVWSDCARCTKQQNCDEIAVVKDLSGA
jgi:amino-acid N-acetyltransferase